MMLTMTETDTGRQRDVGSTIGLPEQHRARLAYVPGLDGLRAIAVVAVLLYHAGLSLWGGFLGVESFFVLSGFLITALLLAEWREHGRVSLLQFWLRRARRLLPALFLLLAGTLLYTMVVLPREAAEVRADTMAALLYVMNWHLILGQQSYFDPAVRPPLLQHLWSLAVEEQFYLLWPLLFAAGMRYLRATGLLLATLATAVASVALMALLYRSGSDPSRIYYGTDTRAAGMLLGAALAFVWTPGNLPAATQPGVGRLLDIAGVLALGGLATAYFWVSEQNPLLYRGGFALVALCTAVLIAASSHPQARLVPRVLGWQPLRWIGLRSYAIYLWHWPIFLVTRPDLDVPLDGWQLLVVRLALVAGIAALSYRWIELPVRHGALGRAWQALEVRRRTLAQPYWHSSSLRRLRLPLVCTLLLTAVMCSARVDAPPAAAPVVRTTPEAPSVALAEPVPATPTVTPVASPRVAGVMATASKPTVTIPTSAGLEPTPVATVTPTSGSLEPTPVPAEPVALDPMLVEELQRLLDDTVADGFIPGAVLSISLPGYVPWSGASGMADRRRDLPMEAGTLVHIASITKMFTAVVVLQLAEEGRLDLDAPVGTWLPGVVPLAGRTTVRHLLSHTSGVFDYLEDRRFFVQAYRNPERTWTPAELVDMVDQFGAAFEPGTPGAWTYSSTNYVILGMLVEQVTGRSLAQEMRQRILDPLQLTHTFFAPQEALEGSLAQGYIDASDRSDVSMTFVFATGNIVSTADDLRRFADALFGGRLLSAESLAMMTAVADTGGAYDMPELQYGLGVMGARLNVGPGLDGKRRPGEVSTVLGHIGGVAGFRSAVWWVPQSGMTISLSLNQADVDPNLLARDVLDTILAWQER